MAKQSARDAYGEAESDVGALLIELRTRLICKEWPMHINWGHVGYLNHIRRELSELLEGVSR